VGDRRLKGEPGLAYSPRVGHRGCCVCACAGGAPGNRKNLGSREVSAAFRVLKRVWPNGDLIPCPSAEPVVGRHPSGSRETLRDRADLDARPDGRLQRRVG
jgi:hypothetical protein